MSCASESKGIQKQELGVNLVFLSALSVLVVNHQKKK